MKTFDLRRLLLLAFCALVLLGCLQHRGDDMATQQVQTGLQRALTTFATARALGAVISVAQGTQVGMQPGGVGMNFAPGQALQPLNELVDHFADLMLAASVAFGIQLLLLKIGTHAAVSALLAATVVAWAALRWHGRSTAWLQPVLAALLLLRLALPLGAVANEAIYQHFMAGEYAEAQQVMDQSPTVAAQPAATPPPAVEPGWLERLRRWLPGLSDVKAEVKARYDALQHAAEAWSERMVRLIAIFLVQTVVLPIGFLWLAWRLARLLGMPARRPPPA